MMTVIELILGLRAARRALMKSDRNLKDIKALINRLDGFITAINSSIYSMQMSINPGNIIIIYVKIPKNWPVSRPQRIFIRKSL